MHDVSIFAIPLVIGLFYLVVWAGCGRDPKPGAIVVRYKPPEGITPAVARFAKHGAADGKTLAAVLVNLAVKAAIEITPSDSQWTVASLAPKPGAPAATDALRRTSNQYSELAPEERRVFDLMFSWGDPVQFRGFEQKRTSVLMADIEASVRDRYEKQLFVRNMGWISAAIFASFGWLLLKAWDMPDPRASLLTLWLFWFTLAMMSMAVARLGQAFRDIARGRTTWLMATNTIVAAAIMFALPVLVGWKMTGLSSQEFVGALLLTVAVHAVSIPCLKRRSQQCRELLDQLAGYGRFLESVDAAQLRQLNTPGRPAELVNEALAYAIALDVSEKWGDRLGGAFSAAAVAIG